MPVSLCQRIIPQKIIKQLQVIYLHFTSENNSYGCTNQVFSKCIVLQRLTFLGVIGWVNSGSKNKLLYMAPLAYILSCNQVNSVPCWQNDAYELAVWIWSVNLTHSICNMMDWAKFMLGWVRFGLVQNIRANPVFPVLNSTCQNHSRRTWAE